MTSDNVKNVGIIMKQKQTLMCFHIIHWISTIKKRPACVCVFCVWKRDFESRTKINYFSDPFQMWPPTSSQWEHNPARHHSISAPHAVSLWRGICYSFLLHHFFPLSLLFFPCFDASLPRSFTSIMPSLPPHPPPHLSTTPSPQYASFSLYLISTPCYFPDASQSIIFSGPSERPCRVWSPLSPLFLSVHLAQTPTYGHKHREGLADCLSVCLEPKKVQELWIAILYRCLQYRQGILPAVTIHSFSVHHRDST